MGAELLYFGPVLSWPGRLLRGQGGDYSLRTRWQRPRLQGTSGKGGIGFLGNVRDLLWIPLQQVRVRAARRDCGLALGAGGGIAAWVGQGGPRERAAGWAALLPWLLPATHAADACLLARSARAGA